MLALLRRQPMPAPHSPRVIERAGILRTILHSWRSHHGIADDPRLAEAARIASRQAALLTCSWRLSMILNRAAGPYPGTIQMLPRHLLAATHLLEAAHLAHRTTPGLRAGTELFQGAAPLIGVLSLFPQRAHLAKPLDHGGLGISRYLASAILAAIIVSLILILPQRAGMHPGAREQEG